MRWYLSNYSKNFKNSVCGTIGPLQDLVTWYKITHAGEQVLQWDFQNKGRSRWTGTSGIVLEVPLHNLLTSMCDFVPCDRIVQRAYFDFVHSFHVKKNIKWHMTGRNDSPKEKQLTALLVTIFVIIVVLLTCSKLMEPVILLW